MDPGRRDLLRRHPLQVSLGSLVGRPFPVTGCRACQDRRNLGHLLRLRLRLKGPSRRPKITWTKPKWYAWMTWMQIWDPWTTTDSRLHRLRPRADRADGLKDGVADGCAGRLADSASGERLFLPSYGSADKLRAPIFERQ